MTTFPPAVMPYLPQVAIHIAAGSLGIITGYAAVSVRKGERLHRAFGKAFVGVMAVMATMAIFLAVSLLNELPGQRGNVAAGVFVLYLLSTGWLAARRDYQIGLLEKVAAAVILGVSGFYLAWGIEATTSPEGSYDGYPAALYYVFGGIAASMVLLDLKVILKGQIAGSSRIARHLWRMNFAFFFAAGSFFLGQQKVMPIWVHGSPVLTILGMAPLGFMAFWLIRVKLTKWWRDDAAAESSDRAPREGLARA